MHTHVKLPIAAVFGIASLSLLSCQKGDGPTLDPTPADPYFSVGASSLTFPADGGSQTVAVTSDAAWTAFSDESWINIVPAVGNGDGSFTVTVDAGSTTTGGITVESGTYRQTIQVERNDALTGERLPTAQVVYNGSDYRNPIHFQLRLGAIDDRGYAYGTGTFIRLEMNLSGLDFSHPFIDIPEGTYPIAASSRSYILDIVDGISQGVHEGNYVDTGEVVIKGNARDGYVVTCNLTLKSGAIVRGYYIGTILWNNPSVLSTLDGDYAIPAISRCAATFAGKQFEGEDVYVWYLDMATRGVYLNNKGYLAGDGVAVQITVTTDMTYDGTFLPEGTYPFVDTSNGYVADTADGGNTSPGYGSWVMMLAGGNGYMSDYAPLYQNTAGGTSEVRVSRSDNGRYTVTIDAVDNLGHKITGTYSGEIPVRDNSGTTR